MSSAAEKGKTIAPYGTWSSPITADILTQKNVFFGDITVTRQSVASADIVFVENRPQESGRAALIKKTIDLKSLSFENPKAEIDLTKGKYNARSGVHEYGGGALATSKENQLLFSHYDTFGVFEVVGEGEPRELTAGNKAHRFADFTTHPKHPFFISVLEDHTIDEPSQVVNSIVCVKEDASVLTLVSGSDFYSNPRISPDGRLLAWVSWNHPSMPFFATELWVAELLLDAKGKTAAIGEAKLIGIKGADKVTQYPHWIDNSTLIYSNDDTEYSNLYKVQVSMNGTVQIGQPQPVCRESLDCDFVSPAWTLNASDFVVLGNGWLVCSVDDRNIGSLALLNTESGQLRALKSPFVVVSQLRALGPEAVVFNGVQSNEPSAIVVMDLSNVIKGTTDEPRWEIIKRSSNVVEQGAVPKEYLTKAEAIEFPTELPDGTKTTAHAIVFPPCNPAYAAPAGTFPPCIVKIHGGPTSAAGMGLTLSFNYWTSRGYMVCSVNYGGSTGYGREYMLRLDGQWGVVDVRDAVAAANYLGSGNDKHSNTAKNGHTNTAQGQRELDRLTENITPSGAVEFTLDNPGSWGLNITDAIMMTTLSAAGALIPGLQLYHGLAVAGLAWMYSKMTHVQQESVTAIPSIGIQLTTTRGFTLPQSLFKKRDSPFYTTSKQTKLIPRDCILDVMTNEAFRRWSVVDYIAVATRPPPSSSTTSRGGQLDVLFPNLLPRLPVVEHVYRSIYPAIFGHAVPVSISSGDEKSKPRADSNRMVISGGSAGGYTVLAALCLYPKAFSAGCSSYGISDVAALDAESHKFESRYTERLMGGKANQIPKVYHERSPLFMADRIKSPVLFLQGDIDKVVPPEQSEGMYKILQKNGVDTKYILFEGEGHGFRKAANIKKALEEEEKWYRTCFNI